MQCWSGNLIDRKWSKLRGSERIGAQKDYAHIKTLWGLRWVDECKVNGVRKTLWEIRCEEDIVRKTLWKRREKEDKSFVHVYGNKLAQRCENDVVRMTLWALRCENDDVRNTFWEIRDEKDAVRKTLWEKHREKDIVRKTLWEKCCEKNVVRKALFNGFKTTQYTVFMLYIKTYKFTDCWSSVGVCALDDGLL